MPFAQIPNTIRSREIEAPIETAHRETGNLSWLWLVIPFLVLLIYAL